MRKCGTRVSPVNPQSIVEGAMDRKRYRMFVLVLAGFGVLMVLLTTKVWADAGCGLDRIEIGASKRGTSR